MSPWIIYIYVLISLVIAFTAFSAGWRAGLSAIGTSFFAFVAGAGLRGGLYGTTRQKVAGLGLAVGLMSITHWVGQDFQFTFLAMTLLAWGWLGFAICFLCITKRFAVSGKS
jgi:hypothetical protein